MPSNLHEDVQPTTVASSGTLRFTVDGDPSLMVRAAAGHRAVMRIVTHLSGPVREAARDHFVIEHFGKRVTVRYELPEPMTLEWLRGRSVTIELAHSAGPRPTDLPSQSLVIRDRRGVVLVSACDGDDAEPAGLDLAIRQVAGLRIGRTRLAFTSGADGVVVPVGQTATLACGFQVYRVRAVRGGRRPAFFVSVV